MSLHEYLPDHYKNVCIIGTHHIGEPTGQMVNCGGWEKDEHGKFSEKANPRINCELIIGAWENKVLNILASEEAAIELLIKWCEEEEAQTENISAFVRVRNHQGRRPITTRLRTRILVGCEWKTRS